MDYLWASPARRWTDLLNSDARDYRGSGGREDRIFLDDWLGPFLRLCGYERERLPGAEGREALRRLRSEMAQIVDAILEGSAPAERELRALNRELALGGRSPLLLAVEGGFELRDLPIRKGVEAVMGLVARSLAETLADGEPERIKRCANPDCGWILYDESRNRSRRWCEARACGNLIKVREFRQRRAALAVEPAGAPEGGPATAWR